MKNLFQPQNSSEKLLFQAHIHFTTVFFTRKKTKFRRFKGCDLMLNISVISQKKTRKTIHKHLLKFFFTYFRFTNLLNGALRINLLCRIVGQISYHKT